MASDNSHNKPRQGAARRLRLICVAILILVLLRLALPYAVKAYVNRQLNRSAEYGGRIGTVNMHLWRGMYRIHEVQIFKRSGEVPEPLFATSQLDLAVEWRELFHGAVVGQVVMQSPRLNFVSGPTDDQTQTGQGEGWDKMLDSLFPFKLNRFTIRDGQVHFQNHHSKPPVDIYVTKVSVTATNLTNSRNLKEKLPAGIIASGTTLGAGGLDLQLQLDPMAASPTYQAICQLTNVDLTAMNDFLRAYGKFDVERGDFALYTSVAGKDGSYEGYFKVFFEHLDVFAWEKERKKNVLEVFWQAIVGTLATTFKNHSKDSLATRIPISGSYAGDKVGVWSAISTLLRNAFIRALVPKIDEQVTVEKVQQKAEATDRLKEAGETATEGQKGANALIKAEPSAQ